VQWLPSFDRVTAGSLFVDGVKAHSRGVRKLFSFWAVAPGQLASRVFSCWCPACVVGKRSVDGGQWEGCVRAEQWQTQEIRTLTDIGIGAQRKKCKARALDICKTELKAGGFCAMETADAMQAEGNTNPVRFYICRLIPWGNGELVKHHTGKRGYVGGRYNKQVVSKGDPLVRVCYYHLDCSVSSSAIFIDSESVSTASGLGIRHVLANGSFIKLVEEPPPPTDHAAAMSALRGAGAADLQRLELSAEERATINGTIAGGSLPALQ
jgi:hypothetical protein